MSTTAFRYDTCRWCGTGIVLPPGEEPMWFHLDEDRSRSCYAASWTEGRGHDLRFDDRRRMVAEPTSFGPPRKPPAPTPQWEYPTATT